MVLGSVHQPLAALAFICAPALPSVRLIPLRSDDRTDGRAGARMKKKNPRPEYRDHKNGRTRAGLNREPIVAIFEI